MVALRRNRQQVFAVHQERAEHLVHVFVGVGGAPTAGPVADAKTFELFNSIQEKGHDEHARTRKESGVGSMGCVRCVRCGQNNVRVLSGGKCQRVGVPGNLRSSLGHTPYSDNSGSGGGLHLSYRMTTTDRPQQQNTNLFAKNCKNTMVIGHSITMRARCRITSFSSSSSLIHSAIAHAVLT